MQIYTVITDASQPNMTRTNASLCQANSKEEVEKLYKGFGDTVLYVHQGSDVGQAYEAYWAANGL